MIVYRLDDRAHVPSPWGTMMYLRDDISESQGVPAHDDRGIAAPPVPAYAYGIWQQDAAPWIDIGRGCIYRGGEVPGRGRAARQHGGQAIHMIPGHAGAIMLAHRPHMDPRPAAGDRHRPRVTAPPQDPTIPGHGGAAGRRVQDTARTSCPRTVRPCRTSTRQDRPHDGQDQSRGTHPPRSSSRAACGPGCPQGARRGATGAPAGTRLVCITGPRSRGSWGGRGGLAASARSAVMSARTWSPDSPAVIRSCMTWRRSRSGPSAEAKARVMSPRRTHDGHDARTCTGPASRNRSGCPKGHAPARTTPAGSWGSGC
jgi:hypothetical protein